MHFTKLPAIAIGSAVALALAASAADRHRHPPRNIISFHSMYGVDGPFTDPANAVRGVPGDEDPWEIGRAVGHLDSDGNLKILVRGLVFKDNDDPALIGKNDEEEFRGLVSCLTEEGDQVVEQNVITRGFRANEDGDSLIRTKIELPDPCVAPIIMVLAGSEDKWFSMTGFESEAEE